MPKRYVTQNVMVLDTPWVRAYMMNHLSKRHIDYEILPKGSGYTEVVNYYIHKTKDVPAALRIAADANRGQQQAAGFAALHAPIGGKRRHGQPSTDKLAAQVNSMLK